MSRKTEVVSISLCPRGTLQNCDTMSYGLCHEMACAGACHSGKTTKPETEVEPSLANACVALGERCKTTPRFPEDARCCTGLDSAGRVADFGRSAGGSRAYMSAFSNQSPSRCLALGTRGCGPQMKQIEAVPCGRGHV